MRTEAGEIARKYGMLASNISNTATVRNVFIIDDNGIIRLILVYPMNIGRNISEILRALNALQVADKNNQMAPANWAPCDPMIVPPPENFELLQKRVSDIEQDDNGMSWYLSFKKPENCQLGNVPNQSYYKNPSSNENNLNKSATMENTANTKQPIKHRNRTIYWNNFQ